jgi:hypothetical protein
VALAEELGARVLFLNLPYQPDKTAKPRVPEKGAGFFVVSADQYSPRLGFATFPIGAVYAAVVWGFPSYIFKRPCG